MTDTDDLPDEEVWVASGDVRIPLVKMSDNHLRNAANHMKKTLDELEGYADGDISVWTDIVEKLDKLEGEVARRLNIEPSKGFDKPQPIRPPSLPITPVRQAADDAYRGGLMGR